MDGNRWRWGGGAAARLEAAAVRSAPIPCSPRRRVGWARRFRGAQSPGGAPQQGTTETDGGRGQAGGAGAGAGSGVGGGAHAGVGMPTPQTAMRWGAGGGAVERGVGRGVGARWKRPDACGARGPGGAAVREVVRRRAAAWHPRRRRSCERGARTRRGGRGCRQPHGAGVGARLQGRKVGRGDPCLLLARARDPCLPGDEAALSEL
jgi:hypothetical protein